ncbi:hypothetical protein ACSHWB_38810 [Lentzea sp. HUAS TT2]|uniref:hypothetical protein n=1 Tax=Lentzea sp. HUAS TT2 TaxID=3447454 RepID=UPI003F704934
MAALTNADLLAALTEPRRLAASVEDSGVRFAFYGRMSTGTFQDVQTFRAWQRGGWTVRKPGRCWPPPRILVASSMRSWWGSTSGRFMAISSARWCQD